MFVKKQTKDGDTQHIAVSRTCTKCGYRKNDICTLMGYNVKCVVEKPDWCPCKKVIGYMREATNDCTFCRYNKYNYKKGTPGECLECASLSGRDKFYFVEMPVFEEKNNEGLGSIDVKQAENIAAKRR